MTKHDQGVQQFAESKSGVLTRIHKGSIVTYEEGPLFFCAVWSHRTKRPSEHIRFKHIEQRNAFVEKWTERLTLEHMRVQEMQQKMVAGIDSINVGDVLYDSWGYEQTNIDFYVVTRRNGMSFWLRRLAATRDETGFMSGVTSPIIDSPDGPEIYKRATIYGLRENGLLTKWDNVPVPCSWYA